MQNSLISAFRYHRQQRAVLNRGKAGPMSASDALSNARTDVANGKARYPTVGASGWRCGSNGKGTTFVENPAQAGLRFVGYADEIAGRSVRHTGWFTDDQQDETLRGVVYQLPSRKGVLQLLAGYEQSANKGSVLLEVGRGDIHREPADEYTSPKDTGAARDAAIAADGLAERTAERSREYSEAFNAGSQWSDLREEIKALRAERKEAQQALKAIRLAAKLARSGTRKPCGGKPNPAIRIIRQRVEALRDQAKEAHDKAKSLVDDNRYGADAFNEGAGEKVIA